MSISSLQWVPFASAAALGLSVAGLFYWLVTSFADVPAEDRSYADVPPLGFRIVWWPIRWISHLLRPLMPRKYLAATLLKLRLAGLDYAIAADQFTAARVIFAALSAALLYWVMLSFERPAQWWPLLAAAVGFVFPAIWLRDRIQARRRDTLKTLPFFLDIITLCVEAGLNLTGALTQSVAKGPAGPLRDEISRVLRDVRAGRSRTDAMRTMSDRMNEPSITNFISALIQAENMGMNLGPIMRAQAEQRRAERFARAEKLAMEAPVKLLLPLIAFIFPCTFVVLGFPIAMKFIHMGM